MAENVVEILVKSTNDTKEGFDSAKSDAELAGDEAGEGFMSKFRSWLVGGQSSFNGGGIGGILSTIFSTGPIGIAALAVAVGAALTELAGLVAGFVAAGAGVGALALVAIPTFEKVKAALADTPAELKKQPPLIREIVGQVNQLKGSFDKIGQSMMPQLLGIFNQGLGIAGQLMPVIATFAKAAAPAVSEVMTALGKSINSQGFKDFVGQFSKISGPSIEAIGGGFIKVAGAVGKLLTVMSAHDVVHALNIAFDIITGTINALTYIVKTSMQGWDNFEQLLRDVASKVKQYFQDMLNWFEGLPGSFDQLIRNIENYWNDFLSFVKAIPGKIVSYFSNLDTQLFSAGASAAGRLADGLLSGLGRVASAAASLAKKVAGFFGLSPAVEGPLSGGGAPEIRGSHFAQSLATGMQSGMGRVGAAAGSLAGAAGASIGSSGGAGGGTQIVLTGTPQLMTFIKLMVPDLMAEIRLRGGGGPNSVQRALGQTG